MAGWLEGSGCGDGEGDGYICMESGRGQTIWSAAVVTDDKHEIQFTQVVVGVFKTHSRFGEIHACTAWASTM